MRSARVLVRVAMIGLALSCSSARGQGTSASQSGDEIRRYEQAVQQASGRTNGGAWWNLAMLYQDSGRFADAERSYNKALELFRSGDPLTLANVMDCMGTMYVQMGRSAEGEQLERKALSIREEKKDSLGIGLSWMHLAMLSLGKQANADGEMYAELAVERLLPKRGESAATSEQTMTALTYLALARCAAHGCKDAMTPLKQAMTIAEAAYPEKSFPVAYVRFLEGYVDWKRGDNREAAKLMKAGADGMEAQLAWGHPTYVSVMRQYEGFLVATKKNFDAAEVRAKLAALPQPQMAAQSARADNALNVSQR